MCSRCDPLTEELNYFRCGNANDSYNDGAHRGSDLHLSEPLIYEIHALPHVTSFIFRL